MKNITAVLILSMAFTSASFACTGFAIESKLGDNFFVFNSENDIAEPARVFKLKANSRIKGEYDNQEQAIEFTTKYDIVGVGALGSLGTGMNSEGLAGSVFNLWETTYPTIKSTDKNVLSILDAHQYVLGNAKNVKEAETLLRNTKIGLDKWDAVLAMGVDYAPRWQLAYQDKSGNKAVFSWIKGEVVATYDDDGTVANTPQNVLMSLKADVDSSDTGKLEGLSGDINSETRYTKAKILSSKAQEYATNREKGLLMASKVSDALVLPEGIQSGYTGSAYHTYYQTVFDLDNGEMHFKNHVSLNWTLVDFK